ncbi:hypothetical protein [Reinekea sp.]|jgi:hypothetical protein|uniref:hypothetical protein n=1 Tax=Reinekea sp. TaxID=1970455 RepID=UPI0039895388
MNYIPENHNAIALDFSAKNYKPENWNAIELDFNDASGGPVLPWKKPNLVKSWTLASNTADHSPALASLMHGATNQADHGSRWLYGQAEHQPQVTIASFGASNQIDHGNQSLWGKADSKAHSITAKHRDSKPRDNFSNQPFNASTHKDRVDYIVPFVVNTAIVDRFQNNPWWHVNVTGHLYDDKSDKRRLLNTDPDRAHLTLAVFGEPYTPQAWNDIGLNFGWIKPSRPAVPHDSSMRLTAKQATPRDSDHGLPWGLGESRWRNWNLPYPVEDNEVPPDPTEPPEIREVYLIMNSLDVRDISTSTPLDIANVSISLNIDSLAWKFSADLFGEGSLALVQPDNSGMKDISVTINGHRWVFAIDRYESDERFPTKKYKIGGSSRTQYMAAPFAPTSTHTNALATTANQAAVQALANTGFTLNWTQGGSDDLPDWQIPIGALRYQNKTPAQIVAQIVTAAGGVMIPQKDADNWKIRPRYRVAPWHWNSATPDVSVYAGMIRSRSAKYEPAQEFNACFVSGTELGVSVDVRRQGSGGTQPMPDVYEDLITDPQPAISRGKAEIASTGNKVIETLSIFIPESQAVPGIIEPGQLLKVLHDVSANDYLGLVLSTSISVTQSGGAAVYQNITIERNP